MFTIEYDSNAGFEIDSNDPMLKRKRTDTVRRAMSELEGHADAKGKSGDSRDSRRYITIPITAVAAAALIAGLIYYLLSPTAANAALIEPDWIPAIELIDEPEIIAVADDELMSDLPVTNDSMAVDALDNGEFFASYTSALYLAAPSTDDRYTVTLSFYEDGDIVIDTPSVTVAELIEIAGIEIDENQSLRLPLNDYICSDTTITVDEIGESYATVEEIVPYEITYEDVKTIPRGTTKTAVAGVNGTKTYTYKLELVNGVERSRELVGESVTAFPKNAVVYRGVGGTLTGADGVTRTYSYYIEVKATTYTGGGITYTGRPAAEGLIAVDPRVIPLNSRVYVKGNYGDFGECIAADIGGGIKGNIIDVYLESDNPYFANFGFRKMYAYILD